MSKKNIILIICIAIAIAIVICALLMVLLPKNSGKQSGTVVMKIIKYDENMEIKKEIDVTRDEEVKQLMEACNEERLDKGEVAQNLAIRNDIKVDLLNGTYFMIQQDVEDYCFYKNTNTNKKMIVKMPAGLIEYIDSNLK